MKCSLILATLGRGKEVVELLNSLCGQTYKDFELIIIDQNQDGKLDSIVEMFKDTMQINHVKVDFTGNARARDHGIGFARGEILAFPDDDCVYETDVLEKVVAEFQKQTDLAILVVGSYDFSKNKFSVGVNHPKPRYLSRFYMMGVEFTHFFHTGRLVAREFYLDQDFGIGSKYSGGEGFELLYRLLRAKCKAFYTPYIKIYHANKGHYEIGGQRMLSYSAGVGAYIRKFTNQKDPVMLYYIVRKMVIAPTIKMLIALLLLNPKKLAYSYNNLRGVWHGFWAYSGRNQDKHNSTADPAYSIDN
jgi:glycosyltransferase involved in cell wall biosynthesis